MRLEEEEEEKLGQQLWNSTNDVGEMMAAIATVVNQLGLLNWPKLTQC